MELYGVSVQNVVIQQDALTSGIGLREGTYSSTHRLPHQAAPVADSATATRNSSWRVSISSLRRARIQTAFTRPEPRVLARL